MRVRAWVWIRVWVRVKVIEGARLGSGSGLGLGFRLVRAWVRVTEKDRNQLPVRAADWNRLSTPLVRVRVRVRV